jgi:hypothetical protein
MLQVYRKETELQDGDAAGRFHLDFPWNVIGILPLKSSLSLRILSLVSVRLFL